MDDFAASVIDIPEGMKLEDFGPKYYAQDSTGVTSNIKVVSNIEIALKCGTKAFQSKLTYLWYNFPVTTSLVSAYKDGFSSSYLDTSY